MEAELNVFDNCTSGTRSQRAPKMAGGLTVLISRIPGNRLFHFSTLFGPASLVHRSTTGQFKLLNGLGQAT